MLLHDERCRGYIGKQHSLGKTILQCIAKITRIVKNISKTAEYLFPAFLFPGSKRKRLFKMNTSTK